jgi:hypothetical protein
VSVVNKANKMIIDNRDLFQSCSGRVLERKGEQIEDVQYVDLLETLKRQPKIREVIVNFKRFGRAYAREIKLFGEAKNAHA